MAEVDHFALGLMMLAFRGFDPPRVLAMGSLLQVASGAWICLVTHVQQTSVGRILYGNLTRVVTLAESRRNGESHLSYPIVHLDAPVPPKIKRKSKSVIPFCLKFQFQIPNHPSCMSQGNSQSQVRTVPQRVELLLPRSVARIAHLDGVCTCPAPVLGVTLRNSTFSWDRATAIQRAPASKSPPLEKLEFWQCHALRVLAAFLTNALPDAKASVTLQSENTLENGVPNPRYMEKS